MAQEELISSFFNLTQLEAEQKTVLGFLNGVLTTFNGLKEAFEEFGKVKSISQAADAIKKYGDNIKDVNVVLNQNVAIQQKSIEVEEQKARVDKETKANTDAITKSTKENSTEFDKIKLQYKELSDLAAKYNQASKQRESLKANGGEFSGEYTRLTKEIEVYDEKLQQARRDLEALKNQLQSLPATELNTSFARGLQTRIDVKENVLQGNDVTNDPAILKRITEIDKLEAKLREVESLKQTIFNNGGNGSPEFVKASNEAEKLTKDIQELTREVSLYNQKIESDKSVGAFTRLQQDLKQAEQHARDLAVVFDKDSEEVQNATTKVNALRKQIEDVKNFVKNGGIVPASEVQAAEGSIDQLNAKLAGLIKSYKALGDNKRDSQEGINKEKEIAATEVELLNAVKRLDITRQLTKEEDLEAGSITKVKEEIDRLTKSYNLLSESSRNSTQGQDLNQRITELKRYYDIHKQGSTVLEDEAKKQEAADKKAAAEAAKLEQQRQRLVQQAINESKEIDRLNSAYKALEIRYTIAANTAKNLAAEQGRNSTAAKEAAAQANKYAEELKKIDAMVGQHTRKVGDYSGQLKGFFEGIQQGAGRLVGTIGTLIGINSAFDAVNFVVNTNKQLDSLTNKLKLVSLSEIDFAKNQEFVLKASSDFGIEIQELTDNFAKFYSASTNAGFTATETRTIFDQFAKAFGNLRLTTEQSNSAFIALDQILSKGKLSAEEIRKQLGNVLPGAFELAAKSIGVTTTQLDKMLREGKVVSNDFLPKFAAELERTFGKNDKVEGLQASINRFHNSLQQLVNDDRSTRFFTQVTEAATGLIETLSRYTKIPVADKLREEQAEISALVGSIINLNTNNKVRTSLIERLDTLYPDFIGFIEKEKLTTEQLNDRLRTTQLLYNERIELATQAAAADVFKADVADAQKVVGATVAGLKRAAQHFGIDTIKFNLGNANDLRELGALLQKKLEEKQNQGENILKGLLGKTEEQQIIRKAFNDAEGPLKASFETPTFTNLANTAANAVTELNKKTKAYAEANADVAAVTAKQKTENEAKLKVEQNELELLKQERDLYLKIDKERAEAEGKTYDPAKDPRIQQLDNDIKVREKNIADLEAALNIEHKAKVVPEVDENAGKKIKDYFEKFQIDLKVKLELDKKKWQDDIDLFKALANADVFNEFDGFSHWGIENGQRLTARKKQLNAEKELVKVERDYEILTINEKEAKELERARNTIKNRTQLAHAIEVITINAGNARELAEQHATDKELEAQVQYASDVIKIRRDIENYIIKSIEDTKKWAGEEVKTFNVKQVVRIEQEADFKQSAVNGKYNADKDLLEQQFIQGKISYERYQQELLALDKKYSIESINIQIDKLRQQLIYTTLDAKEREDILNKMSNLEENRKKQLQKIELDNIQKLAEERKKLHDLEKQFAKETFDLFQSLGDSHFDRESIAIQNEMNLLDKKTEKEVSTVNQSVASQQQKEQEIAKINARADAQKDALDKKQKANDERKAKFDKTMKVLEVTVSTAASVAAIQTKYAEAQANAFAVATNPLTAVYAPIAQAAAAAILTQIPFAIGIGAAQVAAIMAAPTPKYFRGRTENDPYEGLAWVGDGGRSEAIIRKEGAVEITPATDTLTYVRKGDVILPDAQMLENYIVSKPELPTVEQLQKYQMQFAKNTTDRMLQDVVVLSEPNNQEQMQALAADLNKGFKSVVKAIKQNRPIINQKGLTNKDLLMLFGSGYDKR